MQKQRMPRKLVLHRETLKDLNRREELALVAGGYSDVSLCYATQTSPAVCHGPTRPICE